MTSASLTTDGLTSAKSWARPHSVGRRPLEVNDNYYRVPAAGGVNSNIKDMSLWMLAQMGEMPQVLSPQLLETIHQPRVKTPGERGQDAQVPRTAGRRRNMAMAGAATNMPATTSSATAAGSPAIAR